MPLLFLEILFVVLWSTGFIAMEFILADSGPFVMLFWRYFLTGSFALVWACYKGAISGFSKNTFIHGIVIGLSSHFVWLWSVYSAQSYGVLPSHTSLITALQPMVIAIMAGPLLGEPATRQEWAGLCIAFGGIAIAVFDQTALIEPWWAYSLPFLAVMSISLAIVFERHHGRKMKSRAVPFSYSASLVVQFFATAFCALPFALIIENGAVNWTPGYILTLLWLGPVLSLASYGLLWIIVRKANAVRASSLFYFSPPITSLMAWFLFGKGTDSTDIAGMGIAGLGVLLTRIRPGQSIRHLKKPT